MPYSLLWHVLLRKDSLIACIDVVPKNTINANILFSTEGKQLFKEQRVFSGTLFMQGMAVFKIFCKRANCDAQMIPGA